MQSSNLTGANAPLIPDHTLLRPIGRGAYGEVWLARNVMGTLRAVKIIWRRQFASERPYEREFAGIKRYEPVSRSSGGLVHVLHVGRNDAEGYFYYVMELADPAISDRHSTSSEHPNPQSDLPMRGAPETEALLTAYSPRTLRSDLQRLGHLPPADCLRLALDVASGVAQLHRHGLVHRDVKPGNIIYAHGRAKLADIGLVSAAGEGQTFVGTEGYIPPEGPGSPGADLYALGMALYEASTGYSPDHFPDVPAEWFADHAGSDALEFHEVILKACEGQRERRYRSAEAIQADLALLQSGQSVRRVRALERRYARLRLCGVVGALLLVGAFGSALFANYRARVAAASRAKEARLREQAQNSLARAENAERESREQLYTALLEQGRATVLTGERGQRVRALEAVRQASAISNSVALRGVAVAALAVPDVRFERELPTTPDMTVLKLDPGFERVASCRGNGPVEIRSVANQQLLASLPASTNKPGFAGLWSPDGQHFAVSRDYDSVGRINDIEVWEPARTNRVLLLRHCMWGAMSFHPRLPQIMIGQTPHAAVTWDLETGKELSRHRLPGEPVDLEFSPDGERFLALYPDGTNWTVTVNRTADGAALASHAFSARMRECNWHPGGGWLAVPDYNGAVHWMDAETGETRVLGQHKAIAVHAVFSPDGQYLFSGGWDRELICWDARTLLRAFTVGLDSYKIQFRADGHQCAILRSPEVRLQLHTFESPALCGQFAEDIGGILNRAAFSPDGRWLAVSGAKRLMVWNSSSETGTEASGAAATAVRFASNDELFACRVGSCFRWRVIAGTNGAKPVLQPLPLFKPAGFEFCFPTASGVVFTTTHGSKLVGYDQLATEPERWEPTVTGPSGISPDGRWFGVFRSYTPYFYVYRLPEFELVARLTNQARISSFQFSPQSDELAVSSRAGVEFWNTTTWQRMRQLTNASQILYSPDARTFWLSTGLRSAGLYDARTAELLLPLPLNTIPLTLSPDGRYLAACVDGRHVQRWDLVRVRQELRKLGLDWEK